MTKRKTLLLVSLAVVLAMGVGITPAWSYFTDSHWAEGGVDINVKPSTTPHDDFDARIKHFSVENAENATTPVFVRAGVFSSKKLPIVTISGEGWSDKDPSDWTYEIGEGWYYYGTSTDNLTPLKPGETTKELLIELDFPEVLPEKNPEGDVTYKPDGISYGDDYNAVIVYESTPAQYVTDENGNTTTAADWKIESVIKVEE